MHQGWPYHGHSLLEETVTIEKLNKELAKLSYADHKIGNGKLSLFTLRFFEFQISKHLLLPLCRGDSAELQLRQ